MQVTRVRVRCVTHGSLSAKGGTGVLAVPQYPCTHRKRAPVDKYIQAALEAANGAPLRYAPGRAIPTPCPHCGAPTLAGWDDTVCASWATLDTVTLTPTQEAACWAHLATTTREIFGTPGHYRFGRIRTAPWMTVINMPTPKGLILPDHKCGTPPPSHNRIPTHPNRHTRYPDRPPF